MGIFVTALSALFDGMLLMFAFPFLGLHPGYWACVLIAYAAQAVISTGTYNGSKTMVETFAAKLNK